MKFTKDYSENVLIVDLNSKEQQLSNEFFSKHLKDLEELCYEFRAELDKSVIDSNYTSSLISTKVLSEYFKKNKAEISEYPIGRCFYISKAFYEYITTCEIDFIVDYIKSGGLIKIVWGNARSEVFQTALQIGDYIVDVANDTVSLKKPKVLISKIGAIDYLNFDSIDEFIAVKEVYHNCEVIVNTIVPEIHDFYPLFNRHKGKLSLIENPVLPYLIQVKRIEISNNQKALTTQEEALVSSFFNAKFIESITKFHDPLIKEITVKKMVQLFNKFMNRK